jgi:hypothetical protein
MSIETFDQRFKRLTSDMLMIDICRLLDIEIRQLMKIRSGQRVELSMNGLRRLCIEQGLDFNSFTRGYDEPWTSELTPAQVITADEPAPTPRAGTIFRPDGSRVPKEAVPKAPVPKIPPQRAKPPVSRGVQVSFRPGKSAPAPMVPERYTADPEEHLFEEADPTPHTPRSSGETMPQPSIAARLREVVSSAFRRNDIESDQAALYSSIALRASSQAPPESEQASAITELVAEVSSLRREIGALHAGVRHLLERS